MPFIEDILRYKSLSIVGLEKNTGKTECLNYVLRRLKDSGRRIALTSIGIDGENVDQVKNTHKPEIELQEDTIFVTSEIHYREKHIVSEIMNVSEQQTSLGRLVTARAKGRGKVLISGPADTSWLKTIIKDMASLNVDTTIVDGALSRLSLGSPAVTESIVLATGAAVSCNITQLVRKTKFVYDLINIEEYEASIKDELINKTKGIWAIDADGVLHDLDIPSVFLLEKNKDKLFTHGTVIYVTGAISDKLLNFLRIQKNVKDIVLIVKDFTKIFLTPQAYNAYLKRGGRIKVLMRTNLIAVTVNPVSPEGYVLDSLTLREAMSEALQIPVYDIKKL
jgi:molybdopterin-guanine dinucleotide biosynthesis protein